MIALAMMQRAHDSIFIGMGGQVRHELGYLDTWHVRGGRLELPPNPIRRSRLHIPEVNMAGGTAIKNQND
jgi:hypothetical protein